LPLKDATSGFRCFKAGLLKRLYKEFGDNIIKAKGFESSLELLLKAINLGSVVAEVPIVLDYGRKGGCSKMRLFSTVFKYLVLLFKRRI